VELDLDNPDSWPDDNAELLALADGTVETKEPEVAEELVVKPEPVAEPKQAPETVETPKLLPVEPAPVAPTPPAPTAPTEFTLTAEQTEQLAKIRGDWGDVIASNFEHTWALEHKLAVQDQVFNDYVRAQQAAQAQNETAEIEAAISASPTLDLWAKAEDQGWFNRSVKVHATLMETDQKYAKSSWEARMKALPERVEALYGSSLERVGDSTTKVAVADVAKAKADAARSKTPAPASLSELSGGSLPEMTELKKLESLNGNQLTDYMNKLASDPQKLDEYLRSLG